MAKTALYKRIYTALREDILAGRLADGERLPSKRALAEEMSVSVITVQAAYDRLIAEGYVKSELRRGYFVTFSKERIPAPMPESPSECTFRWDFKSASAAAEGFPFSEWARLMRQVLSEKDAALLGATDAKGLPELRREIARNLALTRGLHCSPRQIVIGAGSDYLIALLCGFLGAKRVAVEDPGYTKAAKIFETFGAAVHYIPADERGIRMDEIGRVSPEIVHVAPSHSFPTGLVMHPDRRDELLRWVAADASRRIIEDDFENEFCYLGRQHASLAALDKSSRVIYMNTFTRTLAPSMRIGYLVLPPELVPEFDRRMAHLSCTVPTLEQHVLARFLADGSFERHVHRMRSLCRRRRDCLIAALAREFGEKIRVIGYDAGVHVLGELHGIAPDELRRAAERSRIRLAFLDEYAHSPAPDAIILSYAGMSEDDIDAAIRQLAAQMRG